MLIPCPRTRRRWIYGLVAFGVMALPLSPHCRAADDAATGQASATPATPDQDVVALLDKLREQVSAGQTTAPPNDNAVETWLQITKLTASKLSPGAARALDDFVRAVHNAETAEQEAGHGTVALDLLVFADFAVAELKNRLNDGVPAPSASSTVPPRLSPSEHPPPAEVRITDAAAQPPPLEPGATTTTIPLILAAAPTPAAPPALTKPPRNRQRQWIPRWWHPTLSAATR